MNKEILYGIIGLLVGIFITIFVASMMGFGNISQQSFNQKSEALDSHFIEQMIPHHEDAITMAKIAQTKEIEEMRSWYNEWK